MTGLPEATGRPQVTAHHTTAHAGTTEVGDAHIRDAHIRDAHAPDAPGRRPAGWRLLGASVTGASHLRRGVGREDAFAWRRAGRLIVAAVADGAGSRSPTSAIGSHTAVRAATAAVDDGQFLDAFGRGGESALHWLFARALAAVTAEAGLLGLDVDRLATTLAVAVFDGDRVYVGQVGDGIAVVRHDGGIETVAVGRRGEHAGETDFLTAPGAVPARLVTYEGYGVDACALSTDGLEYKITDVRLRTPYERFFVDTWAYAGGETASSVSIESFLVDVDDQTGDDKTLVVAVHGYEGPAGEPYLASAPPLVEPAPAAVPAAEAGASQPAESPYPPESLAPADLAAPRPPWPDPALDDDTRPFTAWTPPVPPVPPPTETGG
ncbi:PP2C family serine/threonine-protein phosphatase [Pseudofrankia sp. BMG5.37]|uniref:PP2C family serine/threonine-protein phosphatase n=1 Tax=Pseudofrankia sp. BMG5.37 TaxID=3050035 RepID=UPI0028952B89|nr:PP2C family serine/threonine-protein phosphatase [Pseudofrankia sp. BMG5.37]MDT3442793.1 PP2C family serine/threonine-protein phosphatase [Pseudofrankia sp. BMG5.37]